MRKRLILLALGAACSGSGTDRDRSQASPERRAEVAARGAQVMPFDLSKTRHVFESQPDGGLQTVSALAPTDSQQIRLIREHLRTERDRFSRGDFDDPMAIHGHAMPGLAELRAGASRIALEYTETADGARLRYRATEAGLIEALHRWFAAQRMDHGAAGS